MGKNHPEYLGVNWHPFILAIIISKSTSPSTQEVLRGQAPIMKWTLAGQIWI